jgi:hypothetical protein
MQGSQEFPIANRAASFTSTPANIRRAVTAATIGTIIEWYDYALYGAASGLIINKLFFPQFSAVGDPGGATRPALVCSEISKSMRALSVFEGREGAHANAPTGISTTNDPLGLTVSLYAKKRLSKKIGMQTTMANRPNPLLILDATPPPKSLRCEASIARRSV